MTAMKQMKSSWKSVWKVLILESLKQLSEYLYICIRRYFPLRNPSYTWISSPFKVSLPITNLSLNEQEQLPELSCDWELQIQFKQNHSWFYGHKSWKIMLTYPKEHWGHWCPLPQHTSVRLAFLHSQLWRRSIAKGWMLRKIWESNFLHLFPTFMTCVLKCRLIHPSNH